MHEGQWKAEQQLLVLPGKLLRTEVKNIIKFSS